jgi:CBS domain-containing protein
METFRVSHLPIVDGGDFLGLISDTDIYDRNMTEEPVSKISFTLFNPFVYEHQHFYEVVELVSRLGLTAIPVLSEKNKYLGVVGYQQLIQTCGNMSATQFPGGILVLEVNVNDYYLSQIARIVEENDAKILSCYVASQPDSVKMDVTLKINRMDLTSIIQTFLRYDYAIKASYRSKDNNDEILRNNYDQFMMYLNV